METTSSIDFVVGIHQWYANRPLLSCEVLDREGICEESQSAFGPGASHLEGEGDYFQEARLT